MECYSNIPPFHHVSAFAPAGLHANATDIMAEMEGFGKSSELLIASKMIEIFLPFLDGSRRADPHAIQTGAAIPRGRRADGEGDPGENGHEANSGSKSLVHEKVVPADPSQPRGAGHMLMRKVGSLRFPVHKLRGSDGHGLIPQVLNGEGHDQAEGVQKNIGSLVVVEIERSRLVLNLFQNGIGEVKSYRD